MNLRARRRIACGAVALVAVAALCWTAFRRAPESEPERTEILEDGRTLAFRGATFGLEHSNSFSHQPRFETFLARLPSIHLFGRPLFRYRGVPPHSHDTRIRSNKPVLILWFVAPPSDRPPAPPLQPDSKSASASPSAPAPAPPRGPSSGPALPPSMVRWQIAAPDGTTHGGTLFQGVPGGSFYNLLPVCIDSYPRRLSNFTVRLFQTTAPGPDGDARHIGAFDVHNPDPYLGPAWTPDSVPARREVDGVACVLQSFEPSDTASDSQPGRGSGSGTDSTRESIQRPFVPEVLTYRSRSDYGRHQGLHTSFATVFRLRDDRRRARVAFEVTDRAPGLPSWEFRYFELKDPGGNTSYACLVETQRVDARTTRFVCSTLPLWADDPAWKVRLRLARSGVPETNRTWTVRGIPFPPTPGTNVVVRETSAPGRPLRIRALGSFDPLASTNTFLPPLPHPALLFEAVGNSAASDVALAPTVRLLEIRDDAGRAIPSVTLLPDPYEDFRNWRMEFTGAEFREGNVPSGMSSVDFTLAFPEEIEFEFGVPSFSPNSVATAAPTSEPVRSHSSRTDTESGLPPAPTRAAR